MDFPDSELADACRRHGLTTPEQIEDEVKTATMYRDLMAQIALSDLEA